MNPFSNNQYEIIRTELFMNLSKCYLMFSMKHSTQRVNEFVSYDTCVWWHVVKSMW